MTNIPVERLTTGTTIYLTTIKWGRLQYRFGGFAVVEEIKFDGNGYALTLEGGESHYVDAGETVQFGRVGEPVLRDIAKVTDSELEAKADADSAVIEAGFSKLKRLHAEIAAYGDAEPSLPSIAAE